MRSSWPILVGVAFIAAAAVWYDANNEAAAMAAASAGHGTDAVAAAQAHDVARAAARNVGGASGELGAKGER